MTEPLYDAERFEQEWEGDLEVLRSLAENGDRPEIPRIIDVSFRGSAEALAALARRASDFGFTVMDRDASEDEQPWLFLERLSTTDEETIRDLTMTCLRIEDIFGVERDGWGCIGQTGSIH